VSPILVIAGCIGGGLIGAVAVSPICYWMARRQHREMREIGDAVIALMKQRQPITLIAGTEEDSPSMTVVNVGAVTTPFPLSGWAAAHKAQPEDATCVTAQRDEASP
jgi:hypothetical protein